MADSCVFVAGLSSDIGKALALMYHEHGYSVVGTYRDEEALKGMPRSDSFLPIRCDLSDHSAIEHVGARLAAANPWSRFIASVGQLEPIGKFFECDVDDWFRSAELNALEQLRLLHVIYPHRLPEATAKLAFLVGGGISGPFPNYSAYCLGKLSLVKMCELLDAEYPDVHAVAIGTGWVNTKIHRQTLAAGQRAGSNLERTREFLEGRSGGTSIEDIFSCIEWCFANDRRLTGGRNFSVVHDAWKSNPTGLLEELRMNKDRFRLRRNEA